MSTGLMPFRSTYQGAMIPRDVTAVLAALGLYGLVNGARRVQQLAPLPEWIRLTEAAAESGLSVTMLRRLVKAGELPSIRDGAIKVRRSDLANIASIGGMAKSRRRRRQ